MSDPIKTEPNASQPAEKRPYKRKRKLIIPDIQIKFVLGTLFVGVIGLVINFQIGILGLWTINQNAASSVEGILEQVKSLFLKEFLISLGILIPLSVSVGVVYSFRFCGPIYRFKKYFSEFSTGRWDSVVTLRQGDQLQDLKSSINQTINSLRDKIFSQQEVLKEAKAYLEKSASTSQQSDQLQRLLHLLESESQHFQAKLGKVESASGAPPSGDPGSPGRENQQNPSEKELTTA